MQKKNLLLGLGAAVVAFSTLFGVVGCNDNNDSTSATDTPSAGTTPSDTPSDTTPAADTTATTEATP